MLKIYDFYKNNFHILDNEDEFQKIYHLLCEVEQELSNDIINEEKLRSLNNEKSLIVCLIEKKFTLFKKLISLFPYNDNGLTRYRYLVDPFSHNIASFIKEDEYRENPYFTNEERAELEKAIYTIDYEKMKTMQIRDVLARAICGTGFPIRNINDIFYYSEAPVLPAMIDCFKKNIITNANDTGGCYDDIAYNDGLTTTFITNIIVDYESLDEANKIVADSLIEKGHAIKTEPNAFSPSTSLIINVECKREDTVEEVSNKLMNLISRFSKQDMLCGRLTIDDMYEYMNNHAKYLSKEDYEKVCSILENGWSIKNIYEALKYFKYLSQMIYYDSNEQQFWSSEYYYDKHIEYLNEQPNMGSGTITQ